MTTSGPDHDRRVDPHLGTLVHIVGGRQERPNLPTTGCPFCPGGIEAPEPYDVRWFPNRWPAMPGERCEVLLYTSDHDATFASLGVDRAAAVVDLWARRTATLGARVDVEYVLAFENRGPEVGATIAHPHGQLYAFDHVPERQRAMLAAGWQPEADPGGRRVASSPEWTVSVPVASPFPIALSVAPRTRIPDVVTLDAAQRRELAGVLVDTFARLDALFDRDLPYMMWLNQRPTDGGEWPQAWLHIEIVSPWRAAGVPRFIAAAEIATGEFFNPVVPEDLARRLASITPVVGPEA
jgi:UDPglucose--hexose-1-phosphate uridylyltransferase